MKKFVSSGSPVFQSGLPQHGFLEPTRTALNDVSASILLWIETGWPSTPLSDPVTPFPKYRADAPPSQPLPRAL